MEDGDWRWWRSRTVAEQLGTFIGNLLLWGFWLGGGAYVIWWLVTN
jgi:hypothetical protein